MQRTAVFARAMTLCVAVTILLWEPEQAQPHPIKEITATTDTLPRVLDPTQAAQLIADWNAYPDKFTGEITGYVFTTFAKKPYANRDRDTIIRYQRALETVLLESEGLNPEDLQLRLTQLDHLFLPGSHVQPKKQNRFKVVQQGSDLSTQHFVMAGGMNSTAHHMIHNGKEFYKSTDPSGYTQINVHNTRPIMHRVDYSSIFWIPRVGHSEDVALQRIAFVANDSSWIYRHTHGIKRNITVDDETSLVKHIRPPVYGVLTDETFQSVPFVFARELVFPKLIIHLKYSTDNSETIKRVTTYIIESVTMRDTIPDDAFKMPAAEGDRIVNYKLTADGRPQVSDASYDVPDLETYLATLKLLDFKR